MLMLQLQVPRELGPGENEEPIVEITFQERSAMENALLEQLQHGRHSLRAECEQSSQVILSQKDLVAERQRPLPLASAAAAQNGGSAEWRRPLEVALARLDTTRNGLGKTLTKAESLREKAELAVREVLDLELGGSAEAAEDQQMDSLMSSLRQMEADYMSRRQEQSHVKSDSKQHEDHVAGASAAMEAADKAVQEMRKRMADHEATISNGQRDVQSKRTMASSDLGALRARVSQELETIKQHQTKLRERALQLQSGSLQDGSSPEASAGQEEMAKLKAEAGRLKARAAELQQEQQAITVDPQQLELQAQEAEASVQRLCEQREGLRLELQRLEDEHLQARAQWQEAMSGLQAARQAKEVSDLHSSSLRRQLEGQWASWHPLWSKRLQVWRSRAQVLSRARQGSELLASATALGWEGLRQEMAVRQEALGAINDLQHQLAQLVQGLSSIEDSALGELES